MTYINNFLPFTFLKFLFTICFTIFMGSFLAGCDSKPNGELLDLSIKASLDDLRKMQTKKASDVLVFGFDLRHSLKEDARQYVPFLKYLEKATGLKFKIYFTAKDEHITDGIGNGVVQFAAAGANTYITAHKKYGVIPVARGLNTNNKAEYNSHLIIPLNSTIKTIEDIRGKRFAFGSKTSTQGYLIPRIILAQHGIMLEDLASYEWTGSHKNTANAVSAGDFEAGGMQDTLALDLEQANIIKPLYISENYPSSGIIASKNVPDNIIAKVKQALIDFKPNGKHSKGLYDWDKTEMPNGFKEAHCEDYDQLRKWMNEFGMLD